LNFEGMEFSPYLAATARWQGSEAYSEKGAGIFSLSVPSSTIAQFEIGPGMQLQVSPYKLGSLNLALGGDVSYAYLAGDRNHSVTANLLGTSIYAQTAAVGRHIMRAGSQIRITNDKNTMSGIIAYHGSFQENANSHSLTASLTTIF